jgi:hypothetical protein
VKRDYTWVLGMFRPTNIRMAKIHLPSLEALAQAMRPAREPVATA